MIEHLLNTYLDGLASVFPLIVFVARYSKISMKGKAWANLFFYICFAGFLSADYIGDKGNNNLFIYNIIPLLLVTTLYFFFRSVLQQKFYQRLNLYMLSGVWLLHIITIRYILLYESFASIYYISFSIFILFNGICYYIQEFRQMGEVAVWKKREFWFISIILFYASISTIIWSSFKILMDKAMADDVSTDEMYYIGDLWKLHNIVFAFCCIVFSLIFLRKK